MDFHIIGIGNSTPCFSVEQTALIQQSTIFSGGKRHFDLVKGFLPSDHQWIYIQSPMEEVFEQYEQAHVSIIIFASGDPLFYGFANTLQYKYPNSNIHTTPYFNAIQLLAHKTNTALNALTAVSVHGRNWQALDSALMSQQVLIGVLTDREKNPKTIAKRLMHYGYTNYTICVGEDLEGKNENIQKLSLEEASQKEFHSLNCVILQQTVKRKQSFGIKDTDFIGLAGRPNMITKMPIRLGCLHLLDVLNAHVFWDIGFCTGSVSIEAKLKKPDLHIIAFEKRPESEDILEANQQKFGALGITSVMGDFFKQDLNKHKKPDTVFIGGHGGRLEEMLHTLDAIVLPKTKIVINAVKESSTTTFIETCKKLNWKISDRMTLTVDSHNPIQLIKAVKG